MSTRKQVIRTIKNVTSGYSSTQIMVRNATSNDPSGPTIAEMADVANHTYENGDFLEVMDIIDRRLNDKGKNWRHVAKCLTLLDYLVRYGSDDVVLWAKDNLYIIQTLREFETPDAVSGGQGAIIRVKAKELTSLLKDDERLRQERELARERSRRRGRSSNRSRDSPEYDDALQKALIASRQTAEEEERRRKGESERDESLERAILLSLEEEEKRKKNQNLLDLDSEPVVNNQQQIIGYDIFGNPIYGNQAMDTGYLQNAYQDALYQQQQQQALLQQQQQQQALLEQQYYQQQMAAQQQALLQQQYYQQQMAAQQAYLQQQQQQQISLKTGSNNPFAFGSSQPEAQPQPQVEEPKVEPVAQPVKPTLTGNQRISEQYSKLNSLLASGPGIDTFGNTGETRIPHQHTKTGTFINSSGTGFRQETNQTGGNPFFSTQYTGVASTAITPAYTGYGFGNQSSTQGQNKQNQNNGNSLIDL